VHGLHHITAIAGAPQENLDFYTGILGMRLVKRSVNQDEPHTYHFYYADAEGHPGCDLTFFPGLTDAAPRPGHGLAVEASLDVPPGSLDYWSSRLEQYGVKTGAIETAFGDTRLPVTDVHGFRLALVERARPARREFTPWEHSPVPADRQIRGLHGARLSEQNADRTSLFLTRLLGLAPMGRDGEWSRFGVGVLPGVVDVRQAPEPQRGAWGIGSVHHLAWRVRSDEEQLAMRDQLEKAGSRLTPVIDRFWFKSVYFREPGGVLFELATDGPGFAIDEPMETLGEDFALPPWLEHRREQFETTLPPLQGPTVRGRP
jgi:glyoxalase family protein